MVRTISEFFDHFFVAFFVCNSYVCCCPEFTVGGDRTILGARIPVLLLLIFHARSYRHWEAREMKQKFGSGVGEPA